MTQFASSKAIAAIAAGEFPGLKIILRHGNPGQGAVISPAFVAQGQRIVSPVTGLVLVNRNRGIENSLWGSIEVGLLSEEDGEKIAIRGYYRGSLDGFAWRNGDLVKEF